MLYLAVPKLPEDRRHQPQKQRPRATCLALAGTREAMHNSWDKNDPKDAQMILHPLRTALAKKALYSGSVPGRSSRAVLQLPQRIVNHGAITPMTCPLRLFQRTN